MGSTSRDNPERSSTYVELIAQSTSRYRQNIKALSCIHVWFPGTDSHIQQTVKRCSDCRRLSRDTIKASAHPWDWPTRPFDSVHIDFLVAVLEKAFCFWWIHTVNGWKKKSCAARILTQLLPLRRWFG